jgi:lipopolysaccharide biosynthesis protein
LDIGLEMINRIIAKNLKFETVIVTYSTPHFEEVLESALESICVEPVILFQTDNYLRDVAPFILAIRKFQPKGNLLKLHTKKSPHLKRETAETWRNSLLDGLLPDTQSVKIINDHLSTYQQPALYCPRKWLSEKKHWGRNGRYVYQMCNELKIPYQKHAPFPMGTMFWCNEQMVNELSKLDFPPMSPQHSERGLMDGTWPHAFERLLGQIVLSNGIGITDEGVNMFVANEKRNGHES